MSTLASSRLQILTTALSNAGTDAFFAWHPVTMGYLHNFHEGAIERFLTLAIHRDGRTAIICPSLSETQARRAGIQDIRSWRDGEDPLALFNQLAEDWNLRTAIIAVDDELPAHMLLAMQASLPAALFKSGGDTICALMRVKTAQEVAYLAKAGEIADEAFTASIGQIRSGMTELQVETILRNEMADRGGIPTFSIVASGPNGAEPHHLSDDTVIKEGDVLIMDFGCSYNGYLSDITRTVAVGSASVEAETMYGLVFDAHMAARESIRVGVPCGAVDKAARDVIDAAGYGEFFMHRTGHGIGLRGHEEPFIIANNPMPLAPGHCFSIEPGIYLPGKFGVRIENIVAVTDSGHDSMNAEPSPTLIVV